MKALRFAALLLPVALAGCLFSTGQFNIDVDLADMNVSGGQAHREYVDLNDNSDYVDHKDDLAGLADLAVIGTATNNTGSPLEFEVWITPNNTAHGTAAAVRTSGTRLWGPFDLAGGESHRVTWDESAALFTAVGKNIVINEMMGDGEFTLYVIRNTLPSAALPQLAGSDLSFTTVQLILTIEGEDN